MKFCSNTILYSGNPNSSIQSLTSSVDHENADGSGNRSTADLVNDTSRLGDSLMRISGIFKYSVNLKWNFCVMTVRR